MYHSCESSSPDNMAQYFLDSRLRGNDTPYPEVPRAPMASPTAGKGKWLLSAKMVRKS